MTTLPKLPPTIGNVPLPGFNAKLAAIRRELPTGARFILDHFSLHDARLFGITLSAGETLGLPLRATGRQLSPARR